jgi:hypothetical protein
MTVEVLVPLTAAREPVPREAVAREAMAESSAHALSWGAIIAGGLAAAGLSLVLLAFGAGAGFSSISPWTPTATSTTFKVTVGIYFVVMAMMASAVGGYLSGRLRTRWAGASPREVFFRDTAHGFLTWAFATILSLTLLATPVASLVGGSSSALARTAGQTTGLLDASVDELLRPNSGNSAASTGVAENAAWRDETGRIFSSAFQNGGEFGPDDRAYLAQVVAARTGLTPLQAQERVTAIIDKAKRTADAARKAAAQMSLWLAAALLVGAFSASLAAIEGGALRDGSWHYKV